MGQPAGLRVHARGWKCSQTRWIRGPSFKHSWVSRHDLWRAWGIHWNRHGRLVSISSFFGVTVPLLGLERYEPQILSIVDWGGWLTAFLEQPGFATLAFTRSKCEHMADFDTLNGHYSALLAIGDAILQRPGLTVVVLAIEKIPSTRYGTLPVPNTHGHDQY